MKHMRSLHHNKSLGLLVIRIIAGVIFMAHGYMKFQDMQGTIMFFTSLHLGAFAAYLVTFVEFFGGLSLIIGYASKIAGGLLAIDMLVAVLDVHKSYGLIGPNGAELALSLFAITLGIAIAGPGRYSLGACCGCPVKSGSCPVDGPCKNCGHKDMPKA